MEKVVMADLKYHWAIPVSDQSKHRNIQACGRKYTTALAETAVLFMAKVKANSDWYCSDCARAARLSLAKESAPKPESPKQTGPLRPNCGDKRTDSDRYAELRKLVEAWQSHITGSSQALADWRHR
jgi:hypothetical protein